MGRKVPRIDFCRLSIRIPWLSFNWSKNCDIIILNRSSKSNEIAIPLESDDIDPIGINSDSVGHLRSLPIEIDPMGRDQSLSPSSPWHSADDILVNPQNPQMETVDLDETSNDEEIYPCYEDDDIEDWLLVIQILFRQETSLFLVQSHWHGLETDHMHYFW